MSDTYRWRHVKTVPGTGGFEGCEITTIDVSRVWKWHEWAEIIALVIGLVCWHFVKPGMAGIISFLMIGTILIGLRLDPNDQFFNRLFSRMFTICELVAFLGIIVLPIARLFHH